MTALMIVAYVVVALVTTRVAYCKIHDPKSYYDERGETFGVSAVVGMVWPILPFIGAGFGFYKLMTLPTPKEKRIEQEKERRRLEREAQELAEKYDLELVTSPSRDPSWGIKRNTDRRCSHDNIGIIPGMQARCFDCGSKTDEVVTVERGLDQIHRQLNRSDEYNSIEGMGM